MIDVSYATIVAIQYNGGKSGMYTIYHVIYGGETGATECSKLNTQDGQPDIISSANHKQLVLSSYNRTEGTEVTLSCYSPYVLNGQSKVTCQSDGTWNVNTIPYCTDKAPSDEGMTDETKILIGVLVGVGAVVVMVLLCIVCVVQGTAKSRRQKRSANKGFQTNKGYTEEVSYVLPPMSSAPPSYSADNLYRTDNPYRGDNPYSGYETSYRRDESVLDKNDNRYRPRSTSVDVTYSRPVDTRPQKAHSVTGSLTKGTRGAQMFYIYKGDPDRNRKQSHRDKERDRPVSEINNRQEKAQSDYGFQVGNWRNPPYRGQVGSSERSAPVSRLPRNNSDLVRADWSSQTDMRYVDEFNTRALFHGRDPFLWRPVDTNWGFHLNRHDI